MDFKEHLRHRIAYLASLIEIMLAAMVLFAVLLASWRLLVESFDLLSTPTATEGFTVFLGHAFNVIIGIEFIKMLAKHTPGATIEVLLFSLAREMVVEHTTPVENLIGIITIALLFVIRKYLFVPSFGAHVAYHEAGDQTAPAPETDPDEVRPVSLIRFLWEQRKNRSDEAGTDDAGSPLPPTAAAE